MSRFKTELCNNLIELGSCKYGERCHYAHGAHELRQVTRRHPKYRTERCKNFELTGKCPFGPRCSYVHPKPDLESLVEQLTRYVHHTKAPKPDSDEDDEEENTLSVFSRTATSASLYSTSESTTSTVSNTKTSSGIVEANKENQLVTNDPRYAYSFIDEQNNLQGKQDIKINCFELPPFFDNQAQRSVQARPLSTLKNHQNLQNSTVDQDNSSLRQSENSKIIERPQVRSAMQPISKNQNVNHRREIIPMEVKNCDFIISPPPPPQFSSPPCSSSSEINSSCNPFVITNPIGEYFRNSTIANTSNEGNSLISNRQYQTRF